MYRDDVEALKARHAVLEAELVERTRARDEVAQMLAEARAREEAERRRADLAAGGPARRWRRGLLIAVAVGVLAVAAVVAFFRLATPERHRVDELIAQFSVFVDQMCACPDPTCTHSVQTDLNRWGERLAKEEDRRSPADLTDAQRKRVTELAIRMGECIAKAEAPRAE